MPARDVSVSGLICESVPDIAATRIVVCACSALPASARASAVRHVASRSSLVRFAIDLAVTAGLCAVLALVAGLTGTTDVGAHVATLSGDGALLSDRGWESADNVVSSATSSCSSPSRSEEHTSELQSLMSISY